MACCTCTYNLGCFDSCDVITLPFKFTQDGTYKIQFETQFRFKTSIEGIIGEDMELDLSVFPENTTIDLKIFNPDGTRYTYTNESITYDCFRIKSEFIKNIDMSTNTACCTPKIYEMTGVNTKTLVYAQWSKYGAIPTIEVYYKEGATYIPIPVQPIFDVMPNPTTITITIPEIPSDNWYIKLS